MPAFHGRVRSLPEVVVTVWAASRGQARAQICRKAREADYPVHFTDVQVRAGQWLDGFSVWVDSPRRALATR